MGELKVRLPNNIENQLKSIATGCFGSKADAIDIAVSKAVDEWVRKTQKILVSHQPPKDPVEAIWCMLSDVKKSGVELQHEAKKIRSSRAMKYRNVPD